MRNFFKRIRSEPAASIVLVLLIACFCIAGFTGFDSLRLTPKSTDTYTIDSRNTSGTTTVSVTPAGVLSSISVHGDGTGDLYGYLANINNSTGNVTLTAADSGKTFVTSTIPVTYTLPANPTSLTYKFVVAGSKTLLVQPTGTDWIINKTGSSGDYYKSSTLGSTLVLKGISASLWSVESEIGTWVEQ